VVVVAGEDWILEDVEGLLDGYWLTEESSG
jgi:hypothetical protein